MKSKKATRTPLFTPEQLQAKKKAIIEERQGIVDRYNDRFARLMKLQSLNAPPVIVLQTVRMLFEAFKDYQVMRAQDVVIREIFEGDMRTKKTKAALKWARGVLKQFDATVFPLEKHMSEQSKPSVSEAIQ